MFGWLFRDSRLDRLHMQHWQLRRAVDRLERKLEKVMATQAEVAADLVALKDKLVKIGDETTKTLAKVTALEALLLAGGNASQEVLDALAAVKAQAQLTDDLVPDEVPPTP